VRLSDQETATLISVERRALREAVLNISLRLFPNYEARRG